MKTGFFVDEKCFWHSGGNYALMAPVGGLVQPLAAGGLPEWSNGFCLLANIAVAIEAVQPLRVAVADWDVHHGNGTEAVFYNRDDVLTISIHQENNYPLDTGNVGAIGEGAGLGFNMNIPLPPGTRAISMPSSAWSCLVCTPSSPTSSSSPAGLTPRARTRFRACCAMPKPTA